VPLLLLLLLSFDDDDDDDEDSIYNVHSCRFSRLLPRIMMLMLILW